jgi:rhodanese-related sulfurtransferase
MNIFSMFSKPNYGMIKAAELKQRIANGDDIVLLDVRQPDEHQQANIKNSILIPLGDIQRRMDELEPVKGKEIIVYCRSGARSAHACSVLTKEGFNVVNLEGGMMAWSQQG